MKIVADTNIPFLKGVLEPYAEVVYMDGRSINREAMMDADAIVIRTRTRCCEETLSGTKVKMIASATIGTDHIDLGCQLHLLRNVRRHFQARHQDGRRRPGYSGRR